jgi:hypothetical protein
MSKNLQDAASWTARAQVNQEYGFAIGRNSRVTGNGLNEVVPCRISARRVEVEDYPRSMFRKH